MPQLSLGWKHERFATGAVKTRKEKDVAGNEGKVICVIKVLKTTWNDDCCLKDCYKPSSRHKL